MNILHVSNTMDRRGGDVQMITNYQLLSVYPDIKQTILCYEYSALASACAEQNIEYITAKKNALNLALCRKIIQFSARHAIDIIHVHDSKSLTVAELAAVFLPKVKIVFSKKRDGAIKKGFWRRFKLNHSRLSRIICLSQAIQRVFDNVLTQPEKAVVIYDGIDVDFYAAQRNTNILHQEFNLSDDTVIVGNAAALVGQKDFFTFLKAAQIILSKTTRKVVFIILGEGKALADLQSYSVELGIADKVIFTGFRADFAQVLPEFHILMMSSVSEGVPLTLLAAMAAKVPVVTTTAGGIGEVINHGQTGMTSPLKNPSLLAEHALLVLEDDALREHLRAQAALLVQEKFTLATAQANYLAFYNQIIS